MSSWSKTQKSPHINSPSQNFMCDLPNKKKKKSYRHQKIKITTTEENHEKEK